MSDREQLENLIEDLQDFNWRAILDDDNLNGALAAVWRRATAELNNFASLLAADYTEVLRVLETLRAEYPEGNVYLDYLSTGGTNMRVTIEMQLPLSKQLMQRVPKTMHAMEFRRYTAAELHNESTRNFDYKRNDGIKVHVFFYAYRDGATCRLVPVTETVTVEKTSYRMVCDE